MLSQIDQQAPKTKGKWNIAKLPGGAGNDGGLLPRDVRRRPSTHKEAYEFIKWLEAPEQQLAAVQGQPDLPSHPEALHDPTVSG